MSTLIRTARVALSVAALAACSLGQAAVAPKAPAPGAATRTAPVAVKNVTPDDGAQRVDVLDPIKITFDGAIDPASVSRAHVVLTSWGVPVGSSMSYDDTTHRITVKPIDIHGGLVHGTTYTLKISGLVDSFGRAVTPFQSSFSTWLDPVRFDKTFYRNDNGAKHGHDKTFYDANGHRTRDVSYTGPGKDGVWGTADDVIGGYSRYDQRPDGLESGEHDFNGPGPDGVWFTADDVLWTYSVETYTPAGAPLGTTWYYVDSQGEACCANSMTYGYDAAGLQASTTWRSAGADGVLDTADDDVGVDVQHYDALGRWVGDTYTTNGVVNSYAVRTWRSDRRIAYTALYWSFGADGVPFTADDVPDRLHVYTYDKRGNVIRYTTYRDAGPDGVWHTADDTPTSYIRYWMDDNDNIVKSASYGDPGPDGVWFTDDDIESGYSEYDASR